MKIVFPEVYVINGINVQPLARGLTIKIKMAAIFFLGKCKSEETAASDSAAELGIQNVGGVFVVLLFGCTTALLMGILEFLWNVRKVAVDERVFKNFI